MEWTTNLPILTAAYATMIVAGAAVMRAGLAREWRAIRLPGADPKKSLALMQSFRVAIIGLCICCLGIGLLADQLWLVILALVIGGEETFESTMAIGAMTHGGGTERS